MHDLFGLDWLLYATAHLVCLNCQFSRLKNVSQETKHTDKRMKRRNERKEIEHQNKHKNENGMGEVYEVAKRNGQTISRWIYIDIDVQQLINANISILKVKVIISIIERFECVW